MIATFSSLIHIPFQDISYKKQQLIIFEVIFKQNFKGAYNNRTLDLLTIIISSCQHYNFK